MVCLYDYWEKKMAHRKYETLKWVYRFMTIKLQIRQKNLLDRHKTDNIIKKRIRKERKKEERFLGIKN